jgi:hypothetical protein
MVSLEDEFAVVSEAAAIVARMVTEYTAAITDDGQCLARGTVSLP